MHLRIVLAALVYFPCLLTLQQTCHASDQQTVKIGVIAPLTGNAAHIGNEIQRTIQVLTEQLSTQKLTHKYEFIIEDGKAAMDNSPSTAARKLIGIDGAKFLITATSGETLQVGPIAQRKKVLTFAVVSSHKDVKHLGDFIFRTFIDVERGMKTLAERIRKDEKTPVALLTEDHVFTQGIKTLLQKHLKDDVVFAEDYPIDSTDLRTVLSKAKSKGAKSYYFNCGHPKTCAIITVQARQLGITASIYSYLHIDNPEYLEAAGDYANGVKFLAPPDIEASSPQYRRFLKRYKSRFGHEAKNDFIARSTYDAAQCIIRGIEAKGVDPSSVVQYLKDYQGEGALGKLSFDENGDIRDIDYVIKVISNGRPLMASP